MKSDWHIDELLPPEELLLPESHVAARYSKSVRTLVNWDNSSKMKELGWPPVVRINGKRHRQLGALRLFDKNLMAKGLVTSDTEEACA